MYDTATDALKRLNGQHKIEMSFLGATRSASYAALHVRLIFHFQFSIPMRYSLIFLLTLFLAAGHVFAQEDDDETTGDYHCLPSVEEVEEEDYDEEAERKIRLQMTQQLNENLKTPENVRTHPRELAVARGLSWLAAHQYANGGWNFDHRFAPECKSQCEGQGTDTTSPNAATAMAILPFLGCGITYKNGPAHYKPTVYRGLQFLCSRMKPDGSFYEENTGMLSHGLAALCLTEAYAMTKDKSLRVPAQKAIDFIVQSQNPDGGWSQTPELPSDTLTTAWQVMALSSGWQAYLKVPPATAQNAMKFLDSVQRDDGSRYLRTADAEEPDTASTAAALLCRRYYGWDRDKEALQTGISWLSETGVPATDLPGNYFATQSLHHYEGKEGREWNAVMEKRVLAAQNTDTAGHAFGSWHNPDATIPGLNGGRLAQTAFSVMMLEVYYRYSPIYKKTVLESSLPLE